MSEAGHVLEREQRLSRSLLWELMRAFFAREGVRAWGKATVPHYITCNAYIADAYARVVDAFLDDTAATRDPSQPLYLVELGAGSGRFGYLFLKKLLARRGPRPGIVYVLTDFAEPLVAAWRAHPALRPFVDAGVLDFALLDGAGDRELRLLERGAVLRPGEVANPMVVIANYYFDSVPQDVFRVENGALQESLVTLTTPAAEPDPRDPAILERVKLSYTDRPIGPGYYGDEELDRILEGYRARLTSTSVRMPVAGLQICRRFRELSGGRMLLLSADKGTVHEQALLRLAPPGLALHGSFSISVNYHAIGEWFRHGGGALLAAPHRHASIAVVAGLLGTEGAVRTRAAFADAIERFGPDDFFALKKGIDATLPTLTLDQLLALQRYACGDAAVFNQSIPALRARVADAGDADKQEIWIAARRAWEHYFHIGESTDLPFNIGLLLYQMGYYAEAIELFEASLALYGRDPRTAYNLCLCHERLRRFDEALRWAGEALAIDPTHQAARAMRIELEARAARRA